MHYVVGLAVLPVVLLVSISGTLLLWKSDYLAWEFRGAQVHPITSAHAATELYLAAERNLSDTNILLLAINTMNAGVHRLYLSNRESAYIDSNGEILDRWSGSGRIDEWLYRFHHRLMLESLGLYIIAATAASVLLILIPSGLFNWWSARSRFRWRIFPAHFKRRGPVVSSHQNLAVIIAAPLIPIMLTGLVLLFPEQAQTLLLPKERALVPIASDSSPRPANREPFIQAAIQRGLDQVDDGSLRSISFYEGRLTLAFQRAGEWHQNGLTRLRFDAASGEAEFTSDSRRHSNAEAAYYLSLPLHTGRTGSLLYKVFSTAVGIGLMWLSALGLWAILLRRKDRFQS